MTTPLNNQSAVASSPPFMAQQTQAQSFQSNTNFNTNYQNNQASYRPTGPPVFSQTGPPVSTQMSSSLPPPPSITNNGPPINTDGSAYHPNHFNAARSSIQGPPVQAPVSLQTQTQQPILNQFNKMSISQQPPQLQQQQQQQAFVPPQPFQQQNPAPTLQKYPNQVAAAVQAESSSAQLGQSVRSNRAQPQAIDLLREKRLILPFSDEADEPIRPVFPHEFYTQVNCTADTIRCTLTAIPETQSLLSKLRLPLGILIHPFKDLESLKVVQSATIVRCRSCRSYINPFVHFLDNTKWRCNMCYSINDLPDEFLFDPVTRSYGDPSKRPEINSSTIEFIAPNEYTLRPPPSAMYLYLLDVSHNAINTGYLASFCETLLENLEKIPGDSRTQIGFITYSSSVHFYNLNITESLTQPRMLIYPDLEDLELPMPDSLMVNLQENKESIQQFLASLPNLFAETFETDSALGTALNSAFLLLKQTGGRISIMQTCLPNVGVGALKVRDESIDKDSTNLAPQTDFYKKLSLDCAAAQICVDLFMFNSMYADLATLSCVSKYSGGEVKYYPGFHVEMFPEQVIRFCVDFKRYLTRKIGFESVMRIRCTRGLAIHTFHGNFFVRSTDLLSLPNINPDAGFGMQVNIEESLSDIPTVCFQAAVLYTSSKSERRIRIHTYCLPVSKSMQELVNGADQEAIIGLVSKMAVDRTAMNSLKEAKEALVNVAIDYLQAYSQTIVSAQRHNSLMSPQSLRLIPAYILALIKNLAFRFGPTKMDDRVYAMNLCKTMPLKYLMMTIYPHLYAVHNLDDKKVIIDNSSSSEHEICIPPRLQLSSEHIDRHGVYIMDCGEAIYMWIGRSVSDLFLEQVFDCKSFQELPDHSNDLPDLDNILSERIRNFLVYLYDSRPFGPTFLFFREDSSKSSLFFQHMHEDKTESTISYYEFLRHLNDQLNN
jgi:protein transport protein SEC24